MQTLHADVLSVGFFVPVIKPNPMKAFKLSS
jgi:hypothetical protein